MDTLQREQRSALMGTIRSKDTKPEMTVRRIAHRLGFRFRLHRRDLPGTPDLVFPRYGTVIFVHGCYWHRHRGCRFAYAPKSNEPFWQAKFDSNVARDERVTGQLKSLGWRVYVVWECETDDETALARRLTAALSPKRGRGS